MEEYKEFTGKNLDEAMAAACDYFGLERGKLEIEIVNDAKSGIFGLVGAKKASVRARKARLESVKLNVGAERQAEDKKQKPAPRGRQEKPREQAAPKGEAARGARSEAEAQAAPKAQSANGKTAHAEDQVPAPAPSDNARQQDRRGGRNEARSEARPERTERNDRSGNRPSRDGERNGNKVSNQEAEGNRGNSREADGNREERPNNRGGRGRPEKGRQPRPERQKKPRPDKPRPSESDAFDEKFPEVPLDTMDQALLESEVLTAVDSMTRHIVGETGKEFEVSNGKARVRIDSGEDSGLLIGRDGQTLSALQYLATCIVSRRMGASVRVQIDAGDYRNRQLEKLRQTALELAQKVKDNGKPQSTRPMSAYLRRVVHMALQEDPDVQTHSKGEGSLKRVVIVPKKK